MTRNQTRDLGPAPELTVSKWLNTQEDLTLEKLRGKVVVIEAFQMLCPGCVSHGLPQAKTVSQMFSRERVAVIGLHSVFEHHDAMTETSLAAFLYEYGISFPVAIDMPGTQAIPKTMEAYGLQGTPSLILIDINGNRRAQFFGQIHDLQLGAEIAFLLADSSKLHATTLEAASDKTMCTGNGCPV